VINFSRDGKRGIPRKRSDNCTFSNSGVNPSEVASSTEVYILILLSQVGLNLIAGLVGAQGRRHPSDYGSQGR
jgi:hypothetical protein